MKRIHLILIFFFIISSYNCFSQKYNFTVGSSNILFERFFNRKVLFNGLSLNTNYYIKNLGLTFDINFYLPSSYYGKVFQYSYNYTTLSDEYSEVPVYIKGGGFSVGPGFSYKVFVSKSLKTIIQTEVNALILNVTQNYNKEPFVRIYGSSDVSPVDIGSASGGLRIMFKIGYIPLSFSLKRHFNIQSKIRFQNFSGYTELKVGIAFPIIFGPPPSTITKIKY